MRVPSDTLDRLLRDRVGNEYAVFFGTVEGRFMPNGQETASGEVIDPLGRIFSWWMDWDTETRAPTLTQWIEVQPEPGWASSREYRAARLAVGLPEYG